MCSTHASLKQELQLRQAEQEQILAATKTRIDEVKAELQQSQLGSVRSSDRDLHDAQTELAVAEKLLHKAREEYEYMQQVLEPVKAGIQQIVAQVIGKKVDTDNIHAIENALHMVEKELLIIVPDLTAPSNDESTSNNGIGGQGTSPTPHPAAPSPLTTLAPGDVTSKYNVRIRPKEHMRKNGTVATPGGESSTERVGVQTKKARDKAAGILEDGDSVIMDRATVKQLASTMTTQHAAKKKKG
ncbi:hypothetical protein AaE_004076 [Aphanomyces astaci]|uniref:Uncharacterized protein n=1 Tax=Aphanomyces astaci TaxID=112090 RepID=A0A6A5AJC0_APHAT|nr:hypothetical protein AaE_004076 [Aphanomyces astaci]